MTARVICGDVAEMCATLDADSFDAVLCDPPYGLSFMGRKWDYEVPDAALWRSVLRVCKPGAHLIAFSSARTYHRAAVQIEDAGFDIRDCIAWMYGSGFPKSLDVSKALDAASGAKREKIGNGTAGLGKGSNGPAHEGGYGASYAITAPAFDAAKEWDGYGTALKPAFEPAVLARKPLDGTVAANVTKWGTGALAIDASKIEGPTNGSSWGGVQSSPIGYAGNVPSGFTAGGRWPSNVLLDEEAGALLDAQSGESDAQPVGDWGTLGSRKSGVHFGDSGGASRFFYCAKASRWERELGCSGLPLRSPADVTGSKDGQARLDSPRTGAGRTSGARNHHPTVKPLALTRYLARLIRPPRPVRILVPFAGSGSEMIGCVLEGWPEVVGIEREAAYVEIASARLRLAAENPRAFEPDVERGDAADERQKDLFAEAGS